MKKSIYVFLLITITITSTRTALAKGKDATVVNMSVNPSWDFGSVIVGQTATRTIAISNASSSTGPLIIWFPSSSVYTAVAANGDPINPGQSKTITVTFRPTSANSYTVSIGIINNSTNLSDPHPISLTGTGTTSNISMSVSTNSLNFGNVPAGQMPSQQFQMTNSPNSTGALNISWAQQNLAYSISPSSAQINPGQSKVFTVTFNTTQPGTYNQILNLGNNSSNLPRPFPITLNGIKAGNAVAMSVSASTIDFGSVKAGQTKTESFTITNDNSSTGTLNISWQALYNSPFEIILFGTPNIPPGQSRQFQIIFRPASRGLMEPDRTDNFNSTWSIISNASNSSSPKNITLKGSSYK